MIRGRVSSEAPDGYYKLARPWVPSSDTTARPMLTVRETRLGAGVDAVAPYANMRDAYPWQEQRFREYRNTGPGAAVTVPDNRPQLTRARPPRTPARRTSATGGPTTGSTTTAGTERADRPSRPVLDPLDAIFAR